MHVVEGIEYEITKAMGESERPKPDKQESDRGPVMSPSNNGLNPDETQRRQDKSTAEMEKCLRCFKIKVKRSLREPKFVLEIVTLFIFVVYAVYTVRMFYANREAADAARDSVTLARKTAHLDQRAWLSVKVTAQPAKALTPNQVIAIFSNHGKTYALNIEACKVVDNTMNNPPVNPVKEPPAFYGCGKVGDWNAHGVLAPNSEAVVDLDSMKEASQPNGGLSSATAAAVNSGTLVDWQYGEVRYDDIFGCRHWVRYCYDRPPSSDGSPSVFTICNGEGRNAVDLNECEGK